MYNHGTPNVGASSAGIVGTTTNNMQKKSRRTVASTNNNTNVGGGGTGVSSANNLNNMPRHQLATNTPLPSSRASRARLGLNPLDDDDQLLPRDLTEEQKLEIKEAFELFDTDKDGAIDC
ncbi:hypothetical protein VP01_791g3 [Puccinia sorghi]|uniref:EF-hand domain-containing protein n=1 Tax=Puccinia sorghi TaxID=27349 RepID=A0A0L6UBP1_9BASI|nr:hypothetical protein VP01_791g3 [Puccinia sorghi]